MSDGLSRCPTSTCAARCGAKSSSKASMTSEKHGEHSPATHANVAGVAGTVDGIILLDASSICVVHTLATSLPANVSGSSSDDMRRLTPLRNMRGPGCEASPTRWPLRPYLDEYLGVRRSDPLLGLHATGIRRLKCPNESSRPSVRLPSSTSNSTR